MLTEGSYTCAQMRLMTMAGTVYGKNDTTR
jgi:hypothetical protein